MAFDICLIKIPVSDLARSVNFYGTALGLACDLVVEQYGWAQFSGARLPLALYVPGKGGGSDQPGGSTGFHLSHPDLDSVLALARRADPEAAVFTNADGSRSLELTDPDGNLIKIMQA
jgi:predicted enzyme related to lactoylglutathione lyase